MSTQESKQWRDGWTAEDPPDVGFAWAPNDGDEYVDRHGDGLVYRDLGVRESSNGTIGVQRLRVGDAATASSWRTLDVDFDCLYVLRGEVTISTANGESVTLHANGAALHPGGCAYQLTSVSDDFEAVQITAPASPGPRLSADPPEGGDAEGEPVYTYDTDDEYRAGDGPRKFFLYRDTGARAATDGRIHLHVVRATEPGPGTGWHYHTMAQWFMVIGGSALLRVEDRPRQPLGWGDAMCLGRGTSMRHNLTDYTGDYLVLEMCIPADYETLAVDEPANADSPA